MKGRESYTVQGYNAKKAVEGAVKEALRGAYEIEKELKSVLKQAKKQEGVNPDLREKINKAVKKHLEKMYVRSGNDSLTQELDIANTVIKQINKLDHAFSADKTQEIQDLAKDVAEYQKGKSEEKNINLDKDRIIGDLNQHLNADSISIYAKIISLGLDSSEQEKVQEIMKGQGNNKSKTPDMPPPPPPGEQKGAFEEGRVARNSFAQDLFTFGDGVGGPFISPESLASSSASVYDDITEAIRKQILEKQNRAILDEILKKEADEQERSRLNALKERELAEYLNGNGKEKADAALKDKEFAESLRQYEIAGYASVSNDPRFKDSFKNPWKDVSPDDNGMKTTTIKNAVGEAVCDLTETRHEKDGNAPNGINSYRKIHFETKLKTGKGPLHLMMALQDQDGNNMPADKALYFTAHYDESGKLTEMSAPAPVQFNGSGKDAIGFIELDGKKYTLPVTKENYEQMRAAVKETSLGVHQSQELAQDMISQDIEGQKHGPNVTKATGTRSLEARMADGSLDAKIASKSTNVGDFDYVSLADNTNNVVEQLSGGKGDIGSSRDSSVERYPSMSSEWSEESDSPSTIGGNYRGSSGVETSEMGFSGGGGSLESVAGLEEPSFVVDEAKAWFAERRRKHETSSPQQSTYKAPSSPPPPPPLGSEQGNAAHMSAAEKAAALAAAHQKSKGLGSEVATPKLAQLAGAGTQAASLVQNAAARESLTNSNGEVVSPEVAGQVNKIRNFHGFPRASANNSQTKSVDGLEQELQNESQARTNSTQQAISGPGVTPKNPNKSAGTGRGGSGQGVTRD